MTRFNPNVMCVYNRLKLLEVVMKIKDLYPAQLVVFGENKLREIGQLSQALVIAPGFELEYYGGEAFLLKNKNRVLVVVSLKTGDIEYPSKIFDILREEKDIEERASMVRDLKEELKMLGFLLTSIPSRKIQMPWSVWERDVESIRTKYALKIKEDLERDALDKERFDVIQEQFISMELGIGKPPKHSKRFLISLSLEDAEEILKRLW